MCRLTPLVLLFVGLIGCGSDAPLRLGAAASLSDVLPELLGSAEVEVVYGGSGALAAQLRHGAPFDALLLADPAALAQTARAGLTDPPIGAFANRLVMVSRDDDATDTDPRQRSLASRGEDPVLEHS